ncbi:MAG: cytochrome B6, partial [Nitrosospira sp.]
MKKMNVLMLGLGLVSFGAGMNSAMGQNGNEARSASEQSRDAVLNAQTVRETPITRPEQKKSEHDRSNIFGSSNAAPSSPAFDSQPDKGKILGFDFYRDPLNAKKPMQTFEEIMKADVADRAKVMKTQHGLLLRRYDLTPRLDREAKMSRGKPLAVGPTARLAGGMNWQKLASMSPSEIRSQNVFPYPTLPHPKQVAGGQVFPQVQIDMFPRLERFDIEFDLPEAFLPEFPPAIFLQNRPELGDVSRGEVVSINNYYRLFKDLLTPVQLD